MDKLVVGLLGHRNAGKTKTWYELFGNKVKTGKKTKKLHLTPEEYADVFLVSQSPEERKISIDAIIGKAGPDIVLCSMQYTPEVMLTIDYFHTNGYAMYIQWLNPGHNDPGDEPYGDYHGVAHQILFRRGMIAIRNSKTDVTNRVQEIREFIYSWVTARNLLRKINSQ